MWLCGGRQKQLPQSMDELVRIKSLIVSHLESSASAGREVVDILNC